MKLSDTYTLSNGIQIPIVGFGTWQTPDGQTTIDAVTAALKAGYHHIDTAQAYKNESGVGHALHNSDIKRQDLFITTKIANYNHSYEKVMASVTESLNKLQTNYLDLLLIHWPNPITNRENWQEANAETWRAMEDLYQKGTVKAIGVSNFRQHHLEALAKTAKISPMVNQIFLAPGELQADVVEYCRQHDMLLEAYSPLGTGKIFKVDTMAAIAKKYQKTIPQIALNWSLRHGFLPLPKSVHENYIIENTDIFDFVLADEDMAQIDKLDGVVGRAVDPDQTDF